MYCRIFEPDRQVIGYGDRFQEIFFVTKGGVKFYNRHGTDSFLMLPTYSFFGEYHILFNLKSVF